MSSNTIVPENADVAPSDAPDPDYVLRLYVTGQTPRSLLAIENMRKICAEHLSDRYKLEVIDIYLHPEACQQQQIIAAPTLIKVLPHPLRRITRAAFAVGAQKIARHLAASTACLAHVVFPLPA